MHDIKQINKFESLVLFHMLDKIIYLAPKYPK